MKGIGTAALLVATGLVFAAPYAAAEERAPASGVYDSLLLAVDPEDGTLTGFEHADWVGNGSESAPQFGCRFALRGQQTAPGRYAIVAWVPGDRIVGERTTIEGVLTAKNATVTATFDQRPDGCQYLFTDGASVDHDLSAKHAWRAVRVVMAKRAYFYSKPSDDARQKSFVVKGDSLGVLSEQPGWAEVEFVADERVAHGWVEAGALFPDHPDK